MTTLTAEETTEDSTGITTTVTEEETTTLLSTMTGIIMPALSFFANLLNGIIQAQKLQAH